MRLLEMELQDFRGIDKSHLVFSAGLTVVEGPNEVGKSSIPEAFKLLRTYKSSSKALAIRDTQPVGRDLGPQVEVLLTAGEYRLRYKKRWLVGNSTELHVEAPIPEQVTGDAAHDRFEQILAETTDVDLLNALDVTQGTSLQQAALASIPTVQSTLQQGDEYSDVDDHDLFAALEEERNLYFTATGRPAREYAAAIADLTQLTERVEELTQKGRAVEQLVGAHLDSRERLDALQKRLHSSQVESDELQSEMRRIEELRDAAAQAQRETEVAQREVEDAAQTRQSRVELVKELDRRHTDVAELTDEATRTTELLSRLTEPVELAKRRFDDVRATQEEALSRAEYAQARVEAFRTQERKQELERRLGQVDKLEQEIDRLLRVQASIVIGGSELAELEQLDLQLRVAEAAAAAAAPKLAVTRLGAVAVSVDGRGIETGELASMPVLQRTTLEIPNIAEIVVDPGITDDTAGGVESDRQSLQECLARLRVATLGEARNQVQQKAQAEQQTGQLRSNLELLLDGKNYQQLRDEHIRVSAASSAEIDLGGVDSIAELELEAERLVRAAEPFETEFKEAEADLAQLNTDINLARIAQAQAEAQYSAVNAECGRVAERLAEQRQITSDEALAETETEARLQLAARKTQAAKSKEELEAADPREVEAAAEYALKALRTDLERVAEARSRYDSLSGQVEQASTAGTYNLIEEAESQLEAAVAHHAAVKRRADSAQLLYDTIVRHKKAAQQKYVAPFQTQIEALGRPLFGSDFSITVSPELKVTSRTLTGQTVPFQSLSAGTREQIALLGRLACAQLVSSDDGAPLILDDVFGFSDSVRLEAINRILTDVGSTTQVILLTCQPDRFPRLGDAKFISLVNGPDNDFLE